jgi:hypothetical protein
MRNKIASKNLTDVTGFVSELTKGDSFISKSVRERASEAAQAELARFLTEGGDEGRTRSILASVLNAFVDSPYHFSEKEIFLLPSALQSRFRAEHLKGLSPQQLKVQILEASYPQFIVPSQQQQPARERVPKESATWIDKVKSNILVQAASVLLLGMGLAGGFYELIQPWLKEEAIRTRDEQIKTKEQMISNLQYRVQHAFKSIAGSNTNNIVPPQLPLKVAVFGELSGRYKEFGLGQFRGVRSGLLHVLVEVLHRTQDDLPLYFDVRVFDTGSPTGGFTQDRSRLAKDFKEAQSTCSVVFGPDSSEMARDLLIDRGLALNVPTILTLAGSPKLRDHKQYGELLWQLSANVDAYSGQMIRYCAEFLIPKPDRIVCLYRDDEYGTSSYKALGDHAAEHGISFEGNVLPAQAVGESNSEYRARLVGKLPALLQTNGSGVSNQVCFIIEVGDQLQWLMQTIRGLRPHFQLATITSVERNLLNTGDFDDALLIYSYVPGSVSVQTLQFHRFCRVAELDAAACLGPSMTPEHWDRPNTIDAEAHDAAVYWFMRFVAPRLSNVSTDLERNLYVTNILPTGHGRDFGNHGSLFIFRMSGTKMIPVESNL